MLVRVAVGGAGKDVAVLHHKGDALLAAPLSFGSEHSKCAEGMIWNR